MAPRRRVREPVARRPRRRPGRVLAMGVLLFAAAVAGLFWLRAAGRLPGGRGDGARGKPPPLVYETGADGTRTARVDVERLTSWCRRQGFPDPPPIDVAEPAVAEAVLEALEQAAAQRSGAALGQVGRIFASLDAHRAGAAFFRLAMDAAPGDFRWPYHLGCLFQERGESEQAVASLEAARTLNPSYPTTYARLGQLYLDAGRVEQADAMFRRYVELRPEDWFGLVGLGRLALERGAPREALGLFERAASLRADDFQVQYNLGRSYAALGDRAAARTHFERAAQLPQGAWFRTRDPLDQELHDSSRSAASLAKEFERLMDSQDWPRLAAIAEQVLARRPNDVIMVANLAGIYRKLGRVDEAHRLLDRALARWPRSIRLLAVRPELYLAQGRYAEALAAADEALGLDRENLQCHNVRGRALFRLGRYREAAQALDYYLGRVPSDAVGHYVLGEVLLASGRLPEAAAAFERAAELQPGLEPAKQRLIQLRRQG